LRPQEASVVQELVLGDRSLMPEYLEEAFGRSDITGIHPKLQNRPSSGSAPYTSRAAPSGWSWLGQRTALDGS
jgi:hypothetical protein